MPQWTTFDEETSSLLRSKQPGETVVELPSESAIEHVLQRGESVVAVLPAAGLGQAGLAVFRWNRIAVAVAPPSPVPVDELPPPAPEPEIERPYKPEPEAKRPSREIRAGGFLGLSDEPIFDDEEEGQEKKSWWKRFWEK